MQEEEDVHRQHEAVVVEVGRCREALPEVPCLVRLPPCGDPSALAPQQHRLLHLPNEGQKVVVVAAAAVVVMVGRRGVVCARAVVEVAAQAARGEAVWLWLLHLL